MHVFAPAGRLLLRGLVRKTHHSVGANEGNAMSTPVSESSVLLVAEAPGASALLASAVRARGAARFKLLVPAVAHGLHRVVDPEDQCCAEAERTIDILRPQLEAAARQPVPAMIGSHEPLAAIADALNSEHFDEVILAGRSGRLARRVRLDLASKVRALGVRVTGGV